MPVAAMQCVVLSACLAQVCRHFQALGPVTMAVDR